MSPEQVVVPVVYGQQVPEEPVTPPDDDVAPPVAGDDSGKFLVRLDNFTGPFDLLLQLIGKHKLDVTEVALHQVTDDFIAYIRAMGDDWDLDEASEFLLVAATLLDLKAARLLPAAEVEDEEDLALLEARDLLFARLLQYKAFKEAAAYIADLEGTGAKRWPRAVSMEQRYAEALPDLVLGIGAERLFKLALKQFAPKPGPPQVSIAHIHQVRVSVREHAQLLRDRIRRAGSATFTLLIADCESILEVVARFLALLELYREGLIDFEQPVSLDELTVRWIGGDVDVEVADLDIDDYEGSPPDPDAAADPDAADQEDTDPDLDDADLDEADSDDADLDDADLDDADLDDADLDDADSDEADSDDADLDEADLDEADSDEADSDDADLDDADSDDADSDDADPDDADSGDGFDEADLGGADLGVPAIDDLGASARGSDLGDGREAVGVGADFGGERVEAGLGSELDEGARLGRRGVPGSEVGPAAGGLGDEGDEQDDDRDLGSGISADSGDARMGSTGARLSDPAEAWAGTIEVPETRADLGGNENDAVADAETPALEERP